MMSSDGSVILLSGGLDSAANLAIESEVGNPKLAVTFDYGQRAFHRELEFSRRFAEFYGIEHTWLEIPSLKTSSNALTKREESLPLLNSSDLDDPAKTTQSARSVWVPNRNGVMIAIAATLAEERSIDRILLGFNSEEAKTFPDNSPGFVEATNQALAFSTSNKVRVHSHTLDMNKQEIVSRLHQIPTEFPFDWVWSCYEGFEKPCGVCESCLRYKRAIESSVGGA